MTGEHNAELSFTHTTANHSQLWFETINHQQTIVHR